MAKQKSDGLYVLIKSLKKSEKRHFKLMAKGDGEQSAPKYLQLFEAIESQKSFNDDDLSHLPFINLAQFSNLKAHLSQKILQCLRQYDAGKVMGIQIRELIDHAQLLFNRGLYKHCHKVLKKASGMVDKSDNLELKLEILKWEKNVIRHMASGGSLEAVDRIIREVEDVNQRINRVNRFSNIQLKLNSLYLKIGFIRNEQDYHKVTNIFNSGIPEYDEESLSLPEKLTLYNLCVGYYFFIQDFETGYAFAQRWVKMLEASKSLIAANLEMYIQGLNNLMIAQSRLQLYNEFMKSKRRLRNLRNTPGLTINENIRLKLFKYTYVHEFNGLFMSGDFDHGVDLITKIKPGLETFIDQLDNHSKIILYYKIGCLYFGNDNYREALVWLNRIINAQELDLREDVHGFARMLNLIGHYELGNMDVIDYYVRSTYRFLLKKEDLHHYQRCILNFLKKMTRRMTADELILHFMNLRQQLLDIVDDPYEKRAFIYFDIISWLESKINRRPVQEVIKEKAKAAEKKIAELA